MDSIVLRCLEALPLLAQAEAPAAPAPAPAGDATQMLSTLLPFLAIGVLFYFLLIRPQRREQSRRQTMLDSVKKNDRVVTIGGMYGVVTNVRREDDELTLKVDEATNTKVRVTVSSIARVLGDGPAEDTSTK